MDELAGRLATWIANRVGRDASDVKLRILKDKVNETHAATNAADPDDRAGPLAREEEAIRELMKYIAEKR